MAGASQQNMAVALVACLALLFRASSAAVSHIVGDATGWTQPSSPTFYNTWASNKNSFHVGDFLVFDFPGSSQTVAEVTKPAYDSCSAATPITEMNNGPVNLTITTPGTHYYISTDAGHCYAGQKFAITAVSTKALPPSAASTPTSAPAGKGSMAPSTAPTKPSTGGKTPRATPMAAPMSPSMAPAVEAPAPESGAPMEAPVTGMTPSAGGPSVASTSSSGGSPAMSPGGESDKGNSAAAVEAGRILPLLLLLGSNLLF